MKLGFISPNLPGHRNPMTALARHLQARNHEVVFLYSTEANGLPFVPGPGKDHIYENRTEQSKRYGEDALRSGLRQVMDQTQIILKSLREIVRTNGVDALVLDTVQFYAELGPMQLGMPYVNVANGLHWDYSGYTPLCVYGWPHETTPAALARNREGVTKWVDLFQSVNRGIRPHAESVGVKIDWSDLSSTISPWASISQTPRAFDFESSHWPSQFYHTGPFHDGRGSERVDFPWERLSGEPLIYASMGTILSGRVDIFQTIVAAVAKYKKLQLVLSIGNQVDPRQIGPVPKNAIAVKRAPQLEIAETGLSLYHPCRVEHRARIFGSRRSASSHPDDL
jgi:UDP:flavonoid glycosyltransferase YjiC (YdhE family)